MRKGFTRKLQADEPATPIKNYITRSGLQRLKDKHRFLLTRERPAVVEVVAWAAGNGDSPGAWRILSPGFNPLTSLDSSWLN
jgi:transcription elongation factor GreB